MQQREKQHGHFQPERLRPCRVHRTGQGWITTRDARREQIAWVRCGAAGLPRTAPDPSREREQVIISQDLLVPIIRRVTPAPRRQEASGRC